MEKKREISRSERNGFMNAEKKSESRKGGVRADVREALFGGFSRGKREGEAAVRDVVVFLLSFVFARCHFIFGAYPFALALIAVLPTEVFVALLGGAVGALTLGAQGAVYALVCAVLVVLRAVISGTGRGGGEERSRPFGESVLLRMSSAVIAGFITAVYALLLDGLSFRTLAYGLTMILTPGLLTVALSGLFGAGIRAREFVFGRTPYFTGQKKGSRHTYDLWFFQGSFLLLSFLLTFALSSYELFGVSLSYLFVGVLTLFTAKRFGALRAMAVGFFSALGVSGLGAVAFSLAGLAAGLLFPLGIGYALIGGGGLLSAWGAYQGGLSGFLSLFPEYAISALFAIPLLRKLTTEKKPEQIASVSGRATDMVGTMALSYRAKKARGLDTLGAAFSSLAPLIRKLGEEDGKPSIEEYKNLCIECSEVYCRTCSGYAVCLSQSHRPFADSADTLAHKLARGEKISVDDLGASLGFCQQEGRILESVRAAAANLAEEKFRNRKTEGTSDVCEMISAMMSEARRRDEEEQAMDETLSETLGRTFAEYGFSDGVIRAFGKRHKYILAAGEDKDGTKITAPALRDALEEQSDGKLSAPEYYRKDDMVLMECHAAPKYRVEYAVSAIAKENTDISGDSVRCFTTDDCFYAILSDGMGTGETAHATSAFSAEFLARTADAGCTQDSALHLLNHVIRERQEECSATVDLFSFDLVSGDAVFYKSGAAPSYIRRGSSIFRVRSQTAPLGLLRRVDAERIRVEVSFDDYVILLSDGISQSPEDAPWLLELLNKPVKRDPKSYAETILAAAVKYNARRDDMSVAVLHILAA